MVFAKCPGCAHEVSVFDKTCSSCGCRLSEDLLSTFDVAVYLAYSKDPIVRMGLAGNPAVDPAVLAKLAKDANSHVRLSASGNPATPQQDLVKLAQQNEHFQIRKQVAQNPSTPTDTLLSLIRDQDTDIRETAVMNPAMPSEVLHEIILGNDVVLRESAAMNPSMPPDVLAVLAEKGSDGLKGRVARNPSTPREAISTLASSDVLAFRQWVAENPSSPPEVLAYLAANDHLWVRESAASNPSTPPETLVSLAQEKDRINRGILMIRVAGNPSAPKDLLAKLAITGDVFSFLVSEMEEAIFDIDELSAKVDNTWKVQSSIAGNPSTPSEVLAYLAKAEFLEPFFGYPPKYRKVPAWILHGLRSICEQVAGNVATPVETLANLAQMYRMEFIFGNPPVKITMPRYLAENRLVRANVAGNPSTSPEVIAELLREDIEHTQEENSRRALDLFEASRNESLTSDRDLSYYNLDPYIDLYTQESIIAFKATRNPSLIKLHTPKYQCEANCIIDALRNAQKPEMSPDSGDCHTVTEDGNFVVNK